MGRRGAGGGLVPPLGWLRRDKPAAYGSIALAEQPHGHASDARGGPITRCLSGDERTIEVVGWP